MIEMTLSDGRRIFGPRELTAQVEAEQDWLQTHATAETRYALLADNGMAWAVADLALTECARLNVPIPQYFTAEQVRHVLDDAGVDVLLTDDPARIAREHPEWRSRARSPISGLYAFERLTTLSARPELPVGACKITYTSESIDELLNKFFSKRFRFIVILDGFCVFRGKCMACQQTHLSAITY